MTKHYQYAILRIVMTQTQKEITQEMPNSHEVQEMVAHHTSQDVRNAVLVVSIVLNLFIFTAWLAMQVTSRYDAQIAGFLFN